MAAAEGRSADSTLEDSGPFRADDLPPLIGRYYVLGSLAKGGMAEILLGCLRGPAGFQRLAVIKRILPHLAGDPRFRDMFLDEARLLSKIHHPNVVQVYELGTESKELYLVMEYLEGENVGGLIRRLRVRGERIDPALAVYIISEACRGLHAAHEVRGSGGQDAGLVHRDVSPSNLFVTYSGLIKVIDFGIAASNEQSAKTEAGEVKGKAAYMAPEQCTGKSVDRRADIFSLGICLFELVTGVALFRRESQFLTMRALCEEPILPPSHFCGGLPAGLDAICLRALARNPASRFINAQEFRGELQELLSAAHSGDLETDLAALMERLFEQRLSEKQAFIEAVALAPELAPRALARAIPASDADTGVALPTVAGFVSRMAVSEAANPSATATTDLIRKAPIAGLATLTLLLLAGLLLWKFNSPDSGSTVVTHQRALLRNLPSAGVTVEPESVTIAASAAPSALPAVSTASASARAPIPRPTHTAKRPPIPNVDDPRRKKP